MGFVRGGVAVRDNDRIAIQGKHPQGLAANGQVIWRQPPTRGEEWTIQSVPVDKYWVDVAFGAGVFVAMATDTGANPYMVSADGINWQMPTLTTPARADWNSMTFGGDRFVAVSGYSGGSIAQGREIVSTDGYNWSHSAALNTAVRTLVRYGAETFLEFSTYMLRTSTTGLTWSAQRSINFYTGTYVYPRPYDIAYGNGIVVAVGSANPHIITSINDGIDWEMQTVPVADTWTGVAYGEGLFVAVSTGNRIMTSPDGINWTLRTSPASNAQWRDVVYGGSRNFVAVAQAGSAGRRVMTSPNGIDWTLRNTPADNSWISVAFGNDKFVAVSNSGTGNRVMTSP